MPSSLRLIALIATALVPAACGAHGSRVDAPSQEKPAQLTPPPPPPATSTPFNPYVQWPNSLPSGVDFFPIAVWLQDPPNATGYQQLGINLYVGLWQGPNTTQLQRLRQSGMPVVAEQNSTALAFAGSPCVGWQQPDEPDNAQWNGSSYGPCVAPAVIEANYLQWKSADPTRPVFLNFGQGVASDTWIGRGVCTGQLQMYADYMRGADIVCFDIYPVNSTDPQVTGNLWYVARGVERLVQWNQQHFGGRKIVWNCVELSNIDGLALPTTAQVRAEVWMSIVHGSMGIMYFVHEFSPTFHEASILTRTEPQYQTLRSGVTALNAQVQRLAPVLNSPTIDGAVWLRNPQPAVPVATMVKRSGGYTWVFAVAMRDAPTTAHFNLASLSSGRTVEVVDEQRNLTAVGQEFSDSFSGYQVHIYRFR